MLEENGGKWGLRGVLSKVLEGKGGQIGEPGGKWGLRGVLSKVLQENGGK